MICKSIQRETKTFAMSQFNMHDIEHLYRALKSKIQELQSR